MPTIGSPSAWRRLCFVLPVIAIVILCSTAMRAPVGVGPATKVVALGPGGRFRSQAGQDLYVYERFFRHRPGPGVYLEFGARDGVVHSNSYAFEQRGWRGFCVEPTDEFHRLVRNRPGCWNYHGAVAARAGARRFVFSKKGGFSGFADDMDPARLEAMRRRGKIARETSVACYTVAGLMRERRVERLAYVSVDVEGAELEVLRSVDWAATPADVVQVESVEGAAKNDTAALVALMARWYHLDVKYDVPPPPCRPGEVTADCTRRPTSVSRRFARDLRARNPPAHARRGAGALEADLRTARGPRRGAAGLETGRLSGARGLLPLRGSTRLGLLTYLAHRSRNSPASTHPRRRTRGRGAASCRDRPMSDWRAGNDDAAFCGDGWPGELVAPAAVVRKRSEGLEL